MRFLRNSDLSPSDVRRAPSLDFLGTRGAVISTMRYSQHPAIRAFLGAWDATGFERKLIPLSAFALKAKVDFAELVGAYLLSFRNLQQQKSALTAMAAHPEVVADSVKFARRFDGISDRRMLHEAVGFLPTPRGLSITQNFAPSEPAEPEAPVETATAPDIEDCFPQINEREEKWQTHRQKLLEGTN